MKRLRLNRETLRVLTAGDLSRVLGRGKGAGTQTVDQDMCISPPPDTKGDNCNVNTDIFAGCTSDCPPDDTNNC